MSSVAAVPSTQELVLGRYRPMRPLGTGGSGSVWLALDEQNGLDVALKIIPREGKAAARAEREALAARRLRHDRCVRAYDVGHDSGHVYIAYEYVPGRTMRDAIRSGALSDEDAITAAAQVLDALAHAHRAGIVHRDVKPANILLEDRDEIAVRLLDFGLAQFDGADTLTAVGDVPGTLAYIAPERLAGADASPQSDVWSVGVLLWETLTDRHPFWGMPIQEVARAIQAGAPPLATQRRGLPRRLIAAVDAALAIEPSRRPSASDLAAELRNASRKPQGREPRRRQRAEPEVEESVAPARRHARRVLPVALGVVTAALGATFLPFWPPELVAVLVLATGLACWLDPRLGLALALAIPIFPLGNVAVAVAVLYGIIAVGWLAANWRDSRHGLWFVTGPLLAAVGLLPLVPLALIPVRNTARRAAHGVLAVLSTVVLAGVSGSEVPIAGGDAARLGVGPLDSVSATAAALWSWLVHEPVVTCRRDRRRSGRGARPVGPAAPAVRHRGDRVRRHRGVGSRRRGCRDHDRRHAGVGRLRPRRRSTAPRLTERTEATTTLVRDARSWLSCAPSNRRSRASSKACSGVPSERMCSRSSSHESS